MSPSYVDYLMLRAANLPRYVLLPTSCGGPSTEIACRLSLIATSTTRTCAISIAHSALFLSDSEILATMIHRTKLSYQKFYGGHPRLGTEGLRKFVCKV